MEAGRASLFRPFPLLKASFFPTWRFQSKRDVVSRLELHWIKEAGRFRGSGKSLDNAAEDCGHRPKEAEPWV
jgi:hypothetical protein